MEHTPNCYDAVRAITFLPGITGNYDVSGGFIEGMKMMKDADGGTMRSGLARSRMARAGRCRNGAFFRKSGRHGAEEDRADRRMQSG